MSVDGAQNWLALQSNTKTVTAELLPVSGETGAVYALTNQSRTPVALGRAALLAANARSITPLTTSPTFAFDTGILAWAIAGLAALALLFAIANDLRNRRTPANKPMVGGMVRHTR